MPTMTDERRFGFAVQFTEPVRLHALDIISTYMARGMWRAELRAAPLHLDWQARWDGEMFIVDAPLPADAVLHDDPENDRYFGGRREVLLAGLRVDDPTQIPDEVITALGQADDALQAERDANLPRLKALVREALERGGT